MVLTSRVPAVSFFGVATDAVAFAGAAAGTGVDAAATFTEDEEAFARELLLAGATAAACALPALYKFATSAESSRMCPSAISGACLSSTDLPWVFT